jgi:hypothetical protein
LEVADVVRAHGAEYRLAHTPSRTQERVLKNIATCRTAALGGHVDTCDSCGHERISYNSCRDRHCPKCQGPRRAQWLAERIERVLPTPYFHVVFTIPDDLNPLALRNKEVVYRVLFEAASRTLLTIARGPRHLGADIGITAVLHTWGQNLLLHPHLHCVVTGGGLSPDTGRWVAGRQRYFLPVKVLGKLFRGKFLSALQRAYKEGELDLADPFAWPALRDRLYRKSWVVYAKAPFGGAEHVFRYLGRYTHRVAISNHRILAVADGTVTFSIKDYRDQAKTKRMTLAGAEFLRRFLLHVLPKGFVRIRHYGLCAGRNVGTKLGAARLLLQPTLASVPATVPSTTPTTPWWERFRQQTGIDIMACPSCGGRLIRRRAVRPEPSVRVTSAPARASPAAA